MFIGTLIASLIPCIPTTLNLTTVLAIVLRSTSFYPHGAEHGVLVRRVIHRTILPLRRFLFRIWIGQFGHLYFYELSL